jgi:hypothetical protein
MAAVMHRNLHFDQAAGSESTLVRLIIPKMPQFSVEYLRRLFVETSTETASVS